MWLEYVIQPDSEVKRLLVCILNGLISWPHIYQNSMFESFEVSIWCVWTMLFDQTYIIYTAKASKNTLLKIYIQKYQIPISICMFLNFNSAIFIILTGYRPLGVAISWSILLTIVMSINTLINVEDESVVSYLYWISPSWFNEGSITVYYIQRVGKI